MNELLNAGFRYSLVRLRDASAAIGLYRGENAERTVLNRRLSAVMENYGYWRNRMVLFTGWNLSMSQAIDPLPFIVQAPRLFAQQISLGDIFQSSTTFHNYSQFAVVLSERVRLVRELSRGDNPPGWVGRLRIRVPARSSGVRPRARREGRV